MMAATKMTQLETEETFSQLASIDRQSTANPEVGTIAKLLGVYDTLLDRFMPPSILVDEQWMVIDTFAGADQYLRFRSRRPTQSVTELACEPLRSAIIEAIDRLCCGENPVVISPLRLVNDVGDRSTRRVTVSDYKATTNTCLTLTYASPSLAPVLSSSKAGTFGLI